MQKKNSNTAHQTLSTKTEKSNAMCATGTNLSMINANKIRHNML